MHATRIALRAAALLLAGWVLAPTAALSDDRYAVISIHNETNSDITVVYRWEGMEERTHRFPPGHKHAFTWEYEKANLDHSPDLILKFDSDTTRGGSFEQTKRLHGFRAPDQSFELGHKWAFRYDGPSKRYITLIDLSK
jgi:hypothetical protein